ncbi:MAG: MAPEG family protein [Alphaproteobacteria bacterium]
MGYFVQLVAIAAIFQFIYFGWMVGKARGKSGLKAPAMAGDDGFERTYRVQMNTLELLVIFMPSLFLASVYFPAILVGGLGAVYIVGRFVYSNAYVSKPSSRGLGFMLSFVPTVALGVLALIGILLNMFGWG